MADYESKLLYENIDETPLNVKTPEFFLRDFYFLMVARRGIPAGRQGTPDPPDGGL